MSTHQEKWIISLFSGLLFFAVSHPDTYIFVQSVVSKTPLDSRLTIANNVGCPTKPGIFVHSIVFVLLVALSMYVSEWIHKKNKKDDDNQ